MTETGSKESCSCAGCQMADCTCAGCLSPTDRKACDGKQNCAQGGCTYVRKKEQGVHINLRNEVDT